MNSRDTSEIARQRLIVALDFPDRAQAVNCTSELAGDVSWFKIGLQLYTAEGPQIVREIAQTGAGVFLDLKLHDIPSTVAKAVIAAASLGVRMLTVHLSGGRAMLEAAVAASPPGLLLLGVTVLTSSDHETLRETGVQSTVEEQTLRLARLGAAAGIGGLIASPHEARALRDELGPAMKIVTPGVRPSWATADDQQRFATPSEAVANGADYLVIGRPVTGQSDRRAAVRRIISEIAGS